jgi:hypothetical protein
VIYFYWKKVDLNTKLANGIYSSTQGIADKITVDWERVKSYSNNELTELEVDFKKLCFSISSIFFNQTNSKKFEANFAKHSRNQHDVLPVDHQARQAKRESERLAKSKFRVLQPVFGAKQNRAQ